MTENFSLSTRILGEVNVKPCLKFVFSEKHIFTIFCAFNISHSKGRVACAVSDRPVGIDIEKLTEKSDTDIKNFAKRYFVENEIALLEKEEYSALAFYKIWTKKEAYSKMLGSALSRNLKIDTTTLDIDTYVEGAYILSVAVNKI